jgi:hypothetical protein
LTVTDTFKGTLGTVTIPPGSGTFTYSRTITNATGGTCQSYPNTATIVQTGLTSSQNVTVCNTATGGLTMGFWQNKNGEGIIAASGPTSGACYVGTWLRSGPAFTLPLVGTGNGSTIVPGAIASGPFGDLSATAACGKVGDTTSATVVGYVYNIIKAANASGTSMNAMLKAQMLATSLDVYFSNPTLGGNKIGAPAPIGGVKIDLTKVCSMIDSSSGTGTCSGSYLNAGPAFGGATSGTVSFLLTYAASQSNTAGSYWYLQNKTTQGLAKNTFDAINNQAAQIAP